MARDDTIMRVKKNFGGKRQGYKGSKWYDNMLLRFLTPLGSNRSMMSRAGNLAGWASPKIIELLAGIPMKKGGRVCGVGKATHGYGRAMRKK